MSEPSTVLMRDLHAFIDRELDPDSMEAVAAHLADSPADAARVAEWQQNAAEIRAAFDEPAQQSTPPQAMTELARMASPRLPFRLQALATAATFLIGVAAGFVLGFSL
jgi:anti-sigma factor RsiW